MKGKMPHIVQYQGSKRNLATQILRYMPKKFNRLLEPFAGMAAISIAVAYTNRTNEFYINDLNEPLLRMLQFAVEHPQDLAESYAQVWQGQFACGDDHASHFYMVRERFNNGEKTPENMLYLLARCVKGSVRYGRNGNFNQSPDKRRHGTHPETVASNVYAISQLLKGKATFSALDYREILQLAKPGDLAYLDPPYQGVSNARDNRYYAGVSFQDFAESIGILERRGIPYLVSYDGTCGGKEYGEELPASLRCKKIVLNAGLSSQAILLGKKSITFESLYVSEALLPFFDNKPTQLPLLEAIYSPVHAHLPSPRCHSACPARALTC